MSDREAIGQVLANIILMKTEKMTENEVLLSGQIVTSFLRDYYNEDILNTFVILYAHSKNITIEELIDNPISAYFDFDDVVSRGNELGWKNHWNEFKEPYCYQWAEQIKN